MRMRPVAGQMSMPPAEEPNRISQSTVPVGVTQVAKPWPANTNAPLWPGVMEGVSHPETQTRRSLLMAVWEHFGLLREGAI